MDTLKVDVAVIGGNRRTERTAGGRETGRPAGDDRAAVRHDLRAGGLMPSKLLVAAADAAHALTTPLGIRFGTDRRIEGP
jgi:hypothetical protein